MINKLMMKRFFKYLKILFVLGLVVFVYGFSALRNAHKKINNIDIKIVNNKHLFITPKTVNKLLKQKLKTIKSNIKDGVFLNTLETAINQNKLVKKADVFIDVNGNLGVLIKQKTPIARVFNKTDTFYIDKMGKKMPMSTNYSADVPIISGISNNIELKKAYILSKFIYDDVFLKEQIIGINLNKNKEFELHIRANNALILLGKIDNLSQKLNNFKAYIMQANLNKWKKNYKKINLKYSNQVVCTK